MQFKIVNYGDNMRNDGSVVAKKSCLGWEEARAWFTDYIAELMATDTNDGYSRVRAEDFEGRDEPDWFVGDGFYDSVGNLALEYSSSRDAADNVEEAYYCGDYYVLEGPAYMGTQDVCKTLGLSKPTVLAMIKRGELKAKRIGNRWAFNADDIAKMLP